MPNNAWQQTIYLQSGSPETENRSVQTAAGGINTSPGYIGQLGSRFIVKDPSDSKKSKGYQLVQLDSVMATLPYSGAVAFWTNRATYLVTTSVATAGRGNVAGIFRVAPVAADITAQNLVCIQIKGPCENANYISGVTSAPDTTGKFVIPSATDGQADCLAAGTAATYPKIGEAIGATSVVGGLTVGPVQVTLADDNV